MEMQIYARGPFNVFLNKLLLRVKWKCESIRNAKVSPSTWRAHLIQFTVSLECFSLSHLSHVGDFDSSFLRRKCVGRR